MRKSYFSEFAYTSSQNILSNNNIVSLDKSGYNSNKGKINVTFMPSKSELIYDETLGLYPKGGAKKMNTINIKLFFEKFKPFLNNAPEKLKNTFLEEFCVVFQKAYVSNSMSNFSAFVSDWSETLEIYSDPETVKEILEAEKEFEEGNGVEWVPGMFLK